MEVNCPQCGKLFKVEDEKLNRILKCSCKLSFRPRHDSKSRVDAKKNKHSNLESPSLIEHSISPPIESHGKFNLQEDEVEQYINSLRETQTTVRNKKDHKQTKIQPSVVPTNPLHLEGEPTQEIPRQNFNSKNKVYLPIFSSAPKDDPLYKQQIAHDTSRASYQTFKNQNPAKAPDKAKKIMFLKEFARSTKGRICFAAGGGGVLLLAVLLAIFSHEEKEFVADAELAALLREPPEDHPPQSSSASRGKSNQRNSLPGSEKVKVVKPKTSTGSIAKKAATTATKKTRKKQPADLRAKGNSVFSQLLDHSYKAEYASLIKKAKSQRQLSLSERALYFEAVFLDQTSSDSVRRAAVSELNQLAEQYPRSSLLVRSMGVYRITHQDNKQVPLGIQQLQALQLTRAKDALVPAYVGLGFYRLKKYSDAINYWNQALTLEPKVTWAAHQKSRTTAQEGAKR